MFKRLDYYILKAFFASLIVVALAIGLTIIVINAVEELSDFIDHQVPISQVLEYYLYFGGWVVKSFLPMFVMLATLFSVSMLARRSEILAMKASGISLYRFILPYLVASLFLACGHFYYSEYIYPDANRKRLEIKEFTIEKRSRRAHSRVHNLYRQISRGQFYTVGSVNVERGEGTDVRIYKRSGRRLAEIITAESMKYSEHRWVGHDVVVRVFDSLADESYTEYEELPLSDIIERPRDFSRRIGKPEDMGLEELQAYIDLMKRTGGPYVREAIDLKVKYSFPLSSCIVILLSIPFAVNPRRGGIAVSFAAGATTSLVYFVLFRSLQSAGYSEKIPEELAVWGVNGLFLIVGLASVWRARK